MRTYSLQTELTQLLTNFEPLVTEKKRLQDEEQQRCSEIQEEANARIEATRATYRSQYKGIETQQYAFFLEISSRISEAILMSKTSEQAFLVDSIDHDNRQIITQKLLDSSGIAMLNPTQTNIPLDDLVNYTALTGEQKSFLLEEIPNRVIHIQYQLIDVGEENKVCCPVHIQPSLSMQNYEIKFNTSQESISSVCNKSEGEVRFTTTQIDEHCGFVYDSLIQLYTQELNEHIVNLVHFHLDDMNEEISIDVVYMLPNQSWQEYKDFDTDAKGMPLRYKILVKNGHVDSVLYNSGSQVERLEFIEKKLKSEGYMKYQDMIVKIMNIPTGMLARDWRGKQMEIPESYLMNAPLDLCHSRHFVDLPGMVDAKVILANNQVVEDGGELALPICCLDTLTESEESMLKSLLESHESAKMGNIRLTFSRLSELSAQARNESVSDKHQLLEDLNNLLSEARRGLSEHEELRSEFAPILQQAERVTRALGISLRYS